MGRDFTKKPGNADSYFLQSAGTQPSNFPFLEVCPDNQTVAFLLEVFYCVLKKQDSWGMIYQFRQTSEQAEGNWSDHESSKPVILGESSCEVLSIISSWQILWQIFSVGLCLPACLLLRNTQPFKHLDGHQLMCTARIALFWGQWTCQLAGHCSVRIGPFHSWLCLYWKMYNLIIPCGFPLVLALNQTWWWMTFRWWWVYGDWPWSQSLKMMWQMKYPCSCFEQIPMQCFSAYDSFQIKDMLNLKRFYL